MGNIKFADSEVQGLGPIFPGETHGWAWLHNPPYVSYDFTVEAKPGWPFTDTKFSFEIKQRFGFVLSPNHPWGPGPYLEVYISNTGFAPTNYVIWMGWTAYYWDLYQASPPP